jgi:curved DNA-binding protein CbpA
VKEDFYSILGAEENASRDEIERLYKRLAWRHHPDRGGNPERMKAINEAYRVLRNDAARASYDAQRPSPLKPLSVSPSSFSPSPSLLEDTLSGRVAGAIFYLLPGLFSLLIFRFYYIRCLWPLFVLAASAVIVGALKIRAALVYAREGLASSHPMRRYVWLQEIAFWLLLGVFGYAIYLLLRVI